jgi:hypothetical protein
MQHKTGNVRRNIFVFQIYDVAAAIESPAEGHNGRQSIQTTRHRDGLLTSRAAHARLVFGLGELENCEKKPKDFLEHRAFERRADKKFIHFLCFAKFAACIKIQRLTYVKSN